MKYKNQNVSKDVVGFDYHIGLVKPIVLCEGVFDGCQYESNSYVW